eukprot:scaffold29797_cov118-Isochrysis_galbana.AAC.1
MKLTIAWGAPSAGVAKRMRMAWCLRAAGKAPATLVQRATAELGDRGGCARAELRIADSPPLILRLPELPYPPPLLSPLLPAMVAAREQGVEEGPCLCTTKSMEGRWQGLELRREVAALASKGEG